MEQFDHYDIFTELDPLNVGSFDFQNFLTVMREKGCKYTDPNILWKFFKDMDQHSLGRIELSDFINRF